LGRAAPVGTTATEAAVCLSVRKVVGEMRAHLERLCGAVEDRCELFGGRARGRRCAFGSAREVLAASISAGRLEPPLGRTDLALDRDHLSKPVGVLALASRLGSHLSRSLSRLLGLSFLVLVSQAVAYVGSRLALVCDRLPLVGQPVALIGLPVTFVGRVIAFIGRAVALLRRPSAHHRLSEIVRRTPPLFTQRRPPVLEGHVVGSQLCRPPFDVPPETSNLGTHTVVGLVQPPSAQALEVCPLRLDFRRPPLEGSAISLELGP
jgi:hypothetical protein